MKKLDFFKFAAMLAALILLFVAGCGDNDNGGITYYTVTFDTQGGENISPKSAKSGEKITLPLPEKAGFSFDGWYSSDKGGAFYGNNGDNHTVTGNVTMYAQWTENVVEPNTYTITFDSNGGSSVSSISGVSGTSVTLPTTTRSGYTFNGWYSAASGGTKYNSPYTITANVTMHAQWTQIGGGVPNLGINGSGNDGDEMTINGIECVLVKAGMFTMGESDLDYVLWSGPATQQVTLTQDYWVSKYEITNAQYGKSVSGKENHPVVSVTWTESDAWARSKGGRLPTEAEWEFAARGGNRSNGYIYSGSNNLGEVGWYYENSSSGTKPVGQKQSNELGIYDMSGNVWEWCNDWYGDYSTSGVMNPTGPSTGDYRVLRGGGWIYDANYCRVAIRGISYPSNGIVNLGFRVVFPRN